MTSKPEMVFTSDWHLERYAWAKHPTLSGDSYYGLSQVVGYCLKHSLPMTAAGDLFDASHPDPLSVWVACVQMQKMQDAGLPVYYIQGQHERSRDKPWLSVHPWPIHVDGVLFFAGPVSLYGMDFKGGSDAVKALDAIPVGTDMLVAHQVWLDLMGSRALPQCAVADAPEVRVIVSGDFHEHMTFDAVGRDSQPVKFVSPGPLCMQAINEPTDKSFFVLNSDMSWTSVPLKTRPVFNIDASRSGYLDEAEDVMSAFDYESLPVEIRTPILVVSHAESSSVSHDDVKARLAGLCHIFFRLSASTSAGSVSYSPVKGRVTLESMLVDALAGDDDALSIVSALLSSESENVDSELKRMYEERTAGR